MKIVDRLLPLLVWLLVVSTAIAQDDMTNTTDTTDTETDPDMTDTDTDTNTTTVVPDDGSNTTEVEESSMIPSDAPSLVPSDSPSRSSEPTLSLAPSIAPTTSQAPSISPAPSSAPSTTPQPSSSAPPSDFPSLFPSGRPTSAPTMLIATPPPQPVAHTGRVLLTLQTVERTMEPSVQDSFNRDMTAFYLQLLGSRQFSGVLAQLDPNSQRLLANTDEGSENDAQGRRQRQRQRRRSTLRRLQTRFPLEAVVTVQARGPAMDDFEELLVDVTNRNETTLIDLFMTSSSIKSRVYFSEVTDVVAAKEEEAVGVQTPAAQAGDGDGGGLSTGALIGIVAGALLAIGLLGGGAFFLFKNQNDDQQPAYGRQENAASARPLAVNGSNNVRNGNTTTTAATTTGNTGAYRTTKAATKYGGAGSSSLHSHDFDDGNSTFGGNASLVETQSQGGADNMSYAYSLDAGNMDNNTIATGYGGGTVTGAGGMDTAHSVVSDFDTVDTSRKAMVQREVIAPPGKLGIVIDTTLEGPVVHKVNAQSPLEGILFPGDVIVSIDNIDTRAMSASAITALMVRTANQRRKLRVLSEDTA